MPKEEKVAPTPPPTPRGMEGVLITIIYDRFILYKVIH